MDSDEENLPENDVEANIQTPKTPIETIEFIHKKLTDASEILTSKNVENFTNIFDQIAVYKEKIRRIRYRYQLCIQRRQKLMKRFWVIRSSIPTFTSQTSPPWDGLILSTSDDDDDLENCMRYVVVYDGGVRVRSTPSFASNKKKKEEIDDQLILWKGDVVVGSGRIMRRGVGDMFVRVRIIELRHPSHYHHDNQGSGEGEEREEGDGSFSYQPSHLKIIQPSPSSSSSGSSGDLFVPETKEGEIIILRRLPP